MRCVQTVEFGRAPALPGEHEQQSKQPPPSAERGASGRPTAAVGLGARPHIRRPRSAGARSVWLGGQTRTCALTLVTALPPRAHNAFARRVEATSGLRLAEL